MLWSLFCGKHKDLLVKIISQLREREKVLRRHASQLDHIQIFLNFFKTVFTSWLFGFHNIAWISQEPVGQPGPTEVAQLPVLGSQGGMSFDHSPALCSSKLSFSSRAPSSRSPGHTDHSPENFNMFVFSLMHLVPTTPCLPCFVFHVWSPQLDYIVRSTTQRPHSNVQKKKKKGTFFIFCNWVKFLVNLILMNGDGAWGI